MIEDTTAASLPGREAIVGLGPVGEAYTRGLWLHSTLAVRWQGHAEDTYDDQSQLIGLVGQSVWVRERKPSRRREKKVARKKLWCDPWMRVRVLSSKMPNLPAWRRGSGTSQKSYDVVLRLASGQCQAVS
ncbi:MAG: hypothetical protein ACP5VQ_08260 [Phycisphaerae bacterium]